MPPDWPDDSAGGLSAECRGSGNDLAPEFRAKDGGALAAPMRAPSDAQLGQRSGREGVYIQRFTLDFDYPVGFTRDLFAPSNPLFAEILARKESGPPHRCVVLIDDGLAEVAVRLAARMLRHAAYLVDFEWRTARVIALAIEPEPSCFLGTTDEVVAFFNEHLFARAAAMSLAGLTRSSTADAESALRRHLGICLDLCHAAVEFEEPAEVFEKLRGAGIGVPKLQISAGLRIPHVNHGTIALLRPFDDGVYMHQVIQRSAKGLRRYVDLDRAFAALYRTDGADGGLEWRVHFHVFVFLDDLGSFASTQSFVREALALHRQKPISDHLETETYTWEVLPEQYQTSSLVAAIVRELQWVRQQLTT